jgi:hypothetical protein
MNHRQALQVKRLTAPVRALFALAAAVLMVPAVFGQAGTSSGINGRVQDDRGKGLGNAAVVVVHEPTGARYTATTLDNGAFLLRGLRPGGPYTIEATAEGFSKGVQKELSLDLDRSADVTIVLKAGDVVVLEELVVKASDLDRIFRADRTGSATSLATIDVENLPVGDRSINSVARLDPSVIFNRDPFDRAISASGISNRYNSIQVDGVNASDPFGLNANNTAAERNVIPLDSLAALDVSTSPYSTRNAGFVGARVNAVTKSGTNELSGSLYYTFRNQNMAADKLDGVDRPLSDFKEQTFGGTLGGPILKNKLFFFLSYEKVDEDRIAPTTTQPVTSDALARIMAAAQRLGIEVGTFETSGNKLGDENILAKLDWNINADHRASFRYNTVTSSRPTFIDFDSNARNISTSTHWYDQEIENTSYVGQLFSRWTDRLNTELSISRSDYHSEPTFKDRLPQVRINNIPLVGTNQTGQFYFGTERSRHMNILDVKTTTIEAIGSYQLNDMHTLNFGVQLERRDTFNAFVQDTLGNYEFTNISDFERADQPGWTGRYILNFPNEGVNPAAEFAADNIGLFVWDSFRPVPALTIGFGLRMDTPQFGDDVPYNATFEQAFGIRNDATYDGSKVIQPRIDFNLQLGSDNSTQLRGGIGLFYGDMPRVWASNSYSNTGFNYSAYNVTNTATPAFSADPDNQPRGTPGARAQQVAFIDPGFELPSRWKTTLGLDHKLGVLGLVGFVNLEFTSVNKDVLFQNINLKEIGTAPDGRKRFSGVIDSRFTNRIIKLTNTEKGSTQSFSIGVERPRQRDGWYGKFTYTNNRAREVQFGTSSTPSSNWQNRSVFNPGEDVSNVAELEVKDRIMATLQKDFELVKGFRTTVSLLYEGRSGYPFSFVFSNDANGDSVTANDLAYIAAANDPKATFATPADADRMALIIQRFGLAPGAVASAGAGRYPWTNQFDLSFKQQIKLPGWKHRAEIGLDILNVGNLLNDKWGIIYGSNQFFRKSETIGSASINSSGQWVISNVSTNLASGTFVPALGRGEPAATRWTALLSLRYKF